ncbi:hypothetical protein AB6E06_22155 [Vibrio splendidus]
MTISKDDELDLILQRVSMQANLLVFESVLFSKLIKRKKESNQPFSRRIASRHER